MSEGVQIRGVVGQIKWAYYTAAGIHGYTVRRDKETGRWSMTGTVVVSDAFKMAQRPLEFVAPTQKGNWRWAIDTIDVRRLVNGSGTVYATLSLQGERVHS